MSRVRTAMLPMSNSHMKLSNFRSVKKKMGEGVGAVLLDAGNGGQSSYRSIEDYIATTGRDPYAGLSSGRGLGKLGKSLESLTIKPKSIRKPKNINFEL
jgi:hypothetical protein